MQNTDEQATYELKNMTRGSMWMYNFSPLFKLIAIYFIFYTMCMLRFSSKNYFKESKKSYFFYLRTVNNYFKPKYILL